MAKHFKLKISRVFPFFFHSCRFIDTSSILPPKSIPRPSPLSAPSSKPKRHVTATSTVSVSCGCRAKPKLTTTKTTTKNPSRVHDTDNTITTPPSWMIYNSSMSFDSSDDQVSSSPTKHIQKVRFSVSSADDNAWFSSEDDSANKAMFSSFQTVSTDSSFEDSGTHLGTISEKALKKKNQKRVKRVVKRYGSKSKKMTFPSPETEVEKDSFAVVKKTEDPYGDFRRSMMEMILEKQMFDTRDLEQLLQCFLSLNSKQHYGVIVEAFSDIWEILFCKSPKNN